MPPMMLRLAFKTTLSLCLFAAILTHAQNPGQSGTPPDPSATEPAHPGNTSPHLTLFPHPDRARWLLSGQANIIFQAHPGFHSPYSGSNSLLARGEYKTSLVGTLYTGFQLNANPRFDTDAIFDLESAGGRGISEALGLAGFTNLDVVRNPNLGPLPYVARAQLHQTIGLTSKLAQAQRTQFSLATRAPQRRIDLRVGKMTLPDFFDVNNPGSDSHLQFLNWTVDNNGAYDYAADTRGYTYAGVAEYDDDNFSARYAFALMPTVANGIDLVSSLRKARGDTYELDWNQGPLRKLVGSRRKGALRLIGFVNHANMGDYRDVNKAALEERAHGDPTAIPSITAHAPQTTMKYGVGLNFEQELPDDVRIFGRFGWNDDQHESYVYTEVAQTFELGGDIAGNRWSRPNDKLGLGLVTNAIKRDHQAYLALGGLGFLLGDGHLNYAREDILETYYTTHNWRGLFTSLDVQLIAHPGYNQDRGPVAVFTLRTHVDF
jgi:carbohydrate-selective porin OprB